VTEALAFVTLVVRDYHVDIRYFTVRRPSGSRIHQGLRVRRSASAATSRSISACSITTRAERWCAVSRPPGSSPNPTPVHVGQSKAGKSQDFAVLCERLAVARAVSVQDMKQTLAENAVRVFAFAGINATFDPFD
jgi:hypothetical protein